jgi:hypothetical protein
MSLKEWLDIAPNTPQITIAGTHPVPLAMAADRVKRPAPATLLTKLNTEGATSAVAGPKSLCPPPPLTSSAAMREGRERMPEILIG